MVQSGHDQLMSILLIDWWWSKWESASLTFWFQLVWGLVLMGNIEYTVNFSHLVGVSISAKELKDIVKYIPWGGTRAPTQGCTIVSFDCSCFDSASPPSLISNCLNSLIGIQGRSSRQTEVYFLLSRNGSHRKVFVPKSMIGPCLVSAYVPRKAEAKGGEGVFPASQWLSYFWSHPEAQLYSALSFTRHPRIHILNLLFCNPARKWPSVFLECISSTSLSTLTLHFVYREGGAHSPIWLELTDD